MFPWGYAPAKRLKTTVLENWRIEVWAYKTALDFALIFDCCSSYLLFFFFFFSCIFFTLQVCRTASEGKLLVRIH